MTTLDEAAEDDSVEKHTLLVALLLSFLKQYHLTGEDDVIRRMLFDIAEDGSCPRPLGSWGYITQRTIREAVSAFEAWKEDGRLLMPAFYKSSTHQTDLENVVTKHHADDTLDLGNLPFGAEGFVRRKADPGLVRPRPCPDWFVPMLPTTDEQVMVVRFDFDGTTYGPDYLTLLAGDEIVPGDEMEQQIEDNGWAYGSVVRSAGGNASLRSGWYPAKFADWRTVTRQIVCDS